ncbi:MAG: exo-alpha-sialidase [Planctomycetota bacterium]
MFAISESSGGGGGGGGGGGSPPGSGGPPGDSATDLEPIQLLATTSEDGSVTLDLPRESARGEPLSYRVVSPPAHGRVSGEPTRLEYTPDSNYHGPDRFTCEVTAAGGRRGAATISLEVRSVNDPPLASSIEVELAENGELILTLQGQDVDGDPLSFELVSGPFHGALSGDGAHRRYDPSLDFVGTDEVTFQVRDPHGESHQGSVRLHVRPQLGIDSVTPDRGPLGVATRLRITGRRFTSATSVRVAGAAATGVVLVDSRTLECDSPLGPLGPADVEVNQANCYGARSSEAYFFEGWEDPSSTMVDVPGGTTSASVPSLVALPGGALACAWIDRRTVQYAVRVARSEDGGRTWSASVVVDDEASVTKSQPKLAAGPGGALALVWQADAIPLYVARSADGGRTWSARVRADDDSGRKYGHSLAFAGGGGLVCAWTNLTRVRVARSVDGTTWSAGADVDAGTVGNQANPSLAPLSAGLACLYSQSVPEGTTSRTELILAKSADGGVSWTRSRVDDDPGFVSGHKRFPTLLELPGGGLVCAWKSPRFDRVRVARSVDGGLSWSASQELEALEEHSRPTLVSDSGGAVICCWQAERGDPGVGDIASARSLDGGQTWSAPLRVDDGPELQHQGDPSLVSLAGGTLVCAWTDQRNGAADVRCARSVDAAASWSASDRVDDDDVEDASQAETAVAIAPDGTVILVWEDGRSARPEVYLTYSVDGCRSWSVNQRLGEPLFQGTARRSDRLPDVAVDASGAWVVTWHVQSTQPGAVVVRRSVDRGATWSDEVFVNPEPQRGYRPTLTVEPGGALLSSYLDGTSPLNPSASETARIARSVDDGRTWGAARAIGNTEGVVRYALAAGSSEWVCAWIEDPISTPSEVCVGRSVDQGQTWTREVRSAGTGSTAPTTVALARGPGSAYALAWIDGDDGVYFVRSVDGGSTWTNAVVLESGDTPQELGIAAGPDGSLVVAWDAVDSFYQTSLHAVRSADGGATFSGTRTGLVYPPAVAFQHRYTRFEDVGIGPRGQIVVVGYTSQAPNDPFVVRGWFRP